MLDFSNKFDNVKIWSSKKQKSVRQQLGAGIQWTLLLSFVPLISFNIGESSQFFVAIALRKSVIFVLSFSKTSYYWNFWKWQALI